MWTQVSLSLHHVWDDALWRATCIWEEDETTEPVVLNLYGRAPVGGLESPTAMLERALQAMQAELKRPLQRPAAD